MVWIGERFGLLRPMKGWLDEGKGYSHSAAVTQKASAFLPVLSGTQSLTEVAPKGTNSAVINSEVEGIVKSKGSNIRH